MINHEQPSEQANMAKSRIEVKKSITGVAESRIEVKKSIAGVAKSCIEVKKLRTEAGESRQNQKMERSNRKSNQR
ncbi:hypothetical protein [Virgibacillus pantothenticus]|uniref:hypothetical protein n=1 Tax=Virgibacillus pantothenticus TaxID=1473 RepID=UPI0009872F90|nr:hypothetical protein [Virgibacillus pantothenticus]